MRKDLETNQFCCFGDYLLDLRQHLLFRGGQSVPLAPKTMEALIALVEKRGDLITKEELRKRLWPDVVVEESNLPLTISALRKALGEERGNGGCIIETIPTRGYRFAAAIRDDLTVNEVAPHEAEARESPAAPPVVTEGVADKSHWFRWWLIPVGLALVAGGTLTFVLLRPPGRPAVLRTFELTSDRRETGGLLVSGTRVYFTENDRDAIRWFSISGRGGAVTPFDTVVPDAALADFTADQSAMLLRKNDGTLWIVGPPSGLPRRVGDLVVRGVARWSPDATLIAYTDGNEIYLVNSDGSGAHKVATAPGRVGHLGWSPDGKVLRFDVRVEKAEFLPTSIWEVRTNGTQLRQVLPGWHNPANECCGAWTPDGRYFVFQTPAIPGGTSVELWAIREKAGFFRSHAEPVNLTAGPTSFWYPALSPNGKTLFAMGNKYKGELVVWDRHRQEFVPHLGGKSRLWVTYSPDGSWIAYTDYATNTLWRMKADGTESRQLTFEPMHVDGLAISPDGHTIALRGYTVGTPSKIYRIPATGGEAQALTPDSNREQGFPSWSSDSRKIVFGDLPESFGKDDGSHAIRVYDLETQTLSSLPGSAGFWTARWSPDGRYISALTIDNRLRNQQQLMLYDMKTQKWRNLQVDQVRDPIWSHDGKYLYFAGQRHRDLLGIFRINISGGAAECVATYANVERAGEWVGLTPDDSPMLLRDLGSWEVYALDVNWP